MTESIKLDRTLGLWSVVLFGLAYMTPMIVFGTFGALASVSAGTTAMAYFIAAAAIFLTAVSYGIMARVYPVAGSAYTYARKSLNSGAGFLVGWAVLLANDGGSVGIVEGQDWGAGNPPEAITDVNRANTRYNSDGGSNIGWGIVPPRP